MFSGFKAIPPRAKNTMRLKLTKEYTADCFLVTTKLNLEYTTDAVYKLSNASIKAYQ